MKHRELPRISQFNLAGHQRNSSPTITSTKDARRAQEVVTGDTRDVIGAERTSGQRAATAMAPSRRRGGANSRARKSRSRLVAFQARKETEKEEVRVRQLREEDEERLRQLRLLTQ